MSVYVPGKPTRAVKMFVVVKPVSMFRIFATLLIINPAATSRPQERAISKTTSARLSRPMRKLDAPRESSFRISPMSARDACQAGSSPDATVARSAVPMAKSKTGGWSRMSNQNGGWVSATARLKALTPKYAAATPSAVPTAANTNASVRNCLTTAPREAPSAVRMPTSLVRCAARSSSRLATLAQAISSTKNTAPSIV